MEVMGQAQIPQGVDQAIRLVFQFSLSVFQTARTPAYHEWARALHAHYTGEPFQQRFSIDLGEARDSLWDGEEPVAVDGGVATSGDSLDAGPMPYVLLVREFAAYVQTHRSPGAVYEDIGHGLEIGDVLLDSLGKLLAGHPISAAVISLIREMGKIARAINGKFSR